VTSPDPKVQKAVRLRLQFKAKTPEELADRARLVAAVSASQAIGYRLPMEGDRAPAASPRPPRAAPACAPCPAPAPCPLPSPEETVDADEFLPAYEYDWVVSGLQDVADRTERVGCPGTCAVRG
jgi:hypothetical protein